MLIELARRLTEAVREVDVVARWDPEALSSSLGRARLIHHSNFMSRQFKPAVTRLAGRGELPAYKAGLRFNDLRTHRCGADDRPRTVPALEDSTRHVIMAKHCLDRRLRSRREHPADRPHLPLPRPVPPQPTMGPPAVDRLSRYCHYPCHCAIFHLSS